MTQRSRSRSAARLGAVQALYQQEMEATPLPRLLREFHAHRLGQVIEDAQFEAAETDFFDTLVAGVDGRREEIDALITAKLAKGWSFARLDRPQKQILRCGVFELIALSDIATGTIINEYVDVADAFYDKPEKAFVNGLLDAVAKDVRD